MVWICPSFQIGMDYSSRSATLDHNHKPFMLAVSREVTMLLKVKTPLG